MNTKKKGDFIAKIWEFFLIDFLVYSFLLLLNIGMYICIHVFFGGGNCSSREFAIKARKTDFKIKARKTT